MLNRTPWRGLGGYDHGTGSLSLRSVFLPGLALLKFESELTPCEPLAMEPDVRGEGEEEGEKEVFDVQSPHEIGSYLAGFSADVQEGTTPSTQLKLRPFGLARLILHT
jgi:hypothetical protein